MALFTVRTPSATMVWWQINLSGDATLWSGTLSRGLVFTQLKSGGDIRLIRNTWTERSIALMTDYRWRKWHYAGTACHPHWQVVLHQVLFRHNSFWTREVQNLNLFHQNLTVQATAIEEVQCSVQTILFPFRHLLQNQDPPTSDLARDPWAWMIILNCVQGVTVSI
jgi:hypothetical protein